MVGCRKIAWVDDTALPDLVSGTLATVSAIETVVYAPSEPEINLLMETPFPLILMTPHLTGRKPIVPGDKSRVESNVNRVTGTDLFAHTKKFLKEIRHPDSANYRTPIYLIEITDGPLDFDYNLVSPQQFIDCGATNYYSIYRQGIGPLITMIEGAFPPRSFYDQENVYTLANCAEYRPVAK